MATSVEIEREKAAVPGSSAEQHLVIHGVSWNDYLATREALDVAGLRMTYCEGRLEFMSPSLAHEATKAMIARLVELFALERDIPLFAYGSATFRSAARERGAEPDICYVCGHEIDEVPDIAIEVVMSHDGLGKLDVYQGLRVAEVWFWQDAGFSLYHLGPCGYEQLPSSRVLPGLDLGVVARYVRMSDQPTAIKAYRDWLRANG